MDVVIESQTNGRVTISVCSPVDDAFTEGWLVSTVSIVAGAWRGRYEAWFDRSDFPNFRHQLEALYSSLEGTARFAPLECQLEMELSVDARGHVHLVGTANDRATDGNELSFTLELDQSYLPTIITQLRAVESAYPPHHGI